MAKSSQLAALADPPVYFRAPKAAGSTARVDREGGKYKAGVIYGVSLITAGEALGHGMWIDETFVEQAREALAAEAGGIKSRWTHPDMSGDGLGKLTSRMFAPVAAAEGRQLLADQHFLEIGHRSPDGDLAGYLMDLAEEDPTAYGLSIVFYPDDAASELHRLENTGADGIFRSPDALNVDNLPHVRLGWLTAADAVDTPAANPNGLFSRKRDIAAEADELFEYALGLREEKPCAVQFGVDADRLRGFAARFLQSHNLHLEGAAMEPETDPAATPAAETPAVTLAATPTTPVAPVAPVEDPRAEAARFRSAFGDEGSVWYAEGLSFEAAQQKQIAKLSERLANVEAKNDAAAQVTGETSAAGFTAGDKTEKPKGFASKIRITGAAAK